MTVAAVHQPQYLPYLGFFDKLAGAEVLVSLDHVQFHYLTAGNGPPARRLERFPSGVKESDERRRAVGIGVSIFMIAIGAILAFAVETNTRGIDLNAVGVILMIVGLVGFVLSPGWSCRSRVMPTCRA